MYVLCTIPGLSCSTSRIVSSPVSVRFLILLISCRWWDPIPLPEPEMRWCSESLKYCASWKRFSEFCKNRNDENTVLLCRGQQSEHHLNNQKYFLFGSQTWFFINKIIFKLRTFGTCTILCGQNNGNVGKYDNFDSFQILHCPLNCPKIK